ncbi:MAG: bifunctional 4-hydroxy-2-oxoglutarate aldolase/2-dehydro-3-deoxy-phosphogluconate aldolase [Alkalilacustris sp.]
MTDGLAAIAVLRVVPVIAIDEAAHAEPLADALLQGGIDVVEITLRTPAALRVIETLARTRPELHVGAGTVLSAADVAAVRDAGAGFALAPGYDPAVVAAARAADLPFAPGIMTPSELGAALAQGLRLVKFFPAQPAGGPAMLRAIAAPFAHLAPRVIPTGGVTEANLADWLAVPQVVAVGGTWIARPEAMRAGRWSEITRLAAEARRAAAG